MICRRVVDSDGVAKIVLEPIDKTGLKTQLPESLPEIVSVVEGFKSR